MTRRQLFLGIAFAVLTTVVWAAEKPEVTASRRAERAGAATTNQVIAYYFHGTVRCETCLKIEKQAREALKRRFEAELKSKRLVFKAVNYEKPENTHFLTDYKLPCPSLVLVRQREGKDLKWKLLGQTWEFVETAPRFDHYIKEETSKFLGEAK